MMYMSKQTTFQSTPLKNGGGYKPAAVNLWNIQIQNFEYEDNGNCPIKTEAIRNLYKVGSVFCDKGDNGNWIFTIDHFKYFFFILVMFFFKYYF